MFFLCAEARSALSPYPHPLGSQAVSAAASCLWAAAETAACTSCLGCSATWPRAQATRACPGQGSGDSLPMCQLLRGTMSAKKRNTIKPTRSQAAFSFPHACQSEQCQWKAISLPQETSGGLSFKQVLWLLLSFNFTYMSFKLAHYYYLSFSRHYILHES